MMKPYKALMIAAALTLGTSVAMTQSSTGPSAKQQATESDLNKSVGDGSSGGPNVGAQEKTGAATNAAPHANMTGAAKANPSTAKAGWPAPGSEDTEFGVLMEPEVRHGEAEVYTGVQA